MDIEAAPQAMQQVPAVFCGPTADAAFFVAVALAVFGLFGLYKLLTTRMNRVALDDSES